MNIRHKSHPWPTAPLREAVSVDPIVLQIVEGTLNSIGNANAPGAPTAPLAVRPLWRGHGRYINSKAASSGHHR